VATTGEPPRGTAVATGSQQEAAAAAATTVVTAVTMVPPAPALTASGRVAVVEIPDDDALPPDGANGRTGSRQPSSLRRGC
jgi:hypothetical protein